MITKIPGQVAVLAVIENNGKYLLQRRSNSSWRSGWFSFVGGRIEGNESLRTALARELKEEIDINADPMDMQFMHTLHISPKVASTEFIYNLFKVTKWSGTPKIAEPGKSDALEWFTLDSLPENTVPLIKKTLISALNGEIYSEYGWREEETEVA